MTNQIITNIIPTASSTRPAPRDMRGTGGAEQLSNADWQNLKAMVDQHFGAAPPAPGPALTAPAPAVDPGTLDLARRCKAALNSSGPEGLLTVDEFVKFGAERLQAILSRTRFGGSAKLAVYDLNSDLTQDEGELIRVASHLKTTVWAASYDALIGLGGEKLAELQALIDGAVGEAAAKVRMASNSWDDYDINEVGRRALAR